MLAYRRFTVQKGRVVRADSGGLVVAAGAPVPHVIGDDLAAVRARQNEVDFAGNVLNFREGDLNGICGL